MTGDLNTIKVKEDRGMSAMDVLIREIKARCWHSQAGRRERDMPSHKKGNRAFRPAEVAEKYVGGSSAGSAGEGMRETLS